MAKEEKKYVGFVEEPQKGVTKLWVARNADGESLGEVAWYSPWRRYCFTPNGWIVFDAKCLGEIMGFLNHQTNLRRLERQAEKLRGE